MKANYFFVNGKVVNVYSGEIIEENVAVTGERISYVGPSRDLIAPETQIIDVKGDYVIPGFFDAHAHADLFCNPFTYADYVVCRGTTGLFHDGHDLANALGSVAFMNTMERLFRSHLSIYAGVPAASPPFPGIEGGELWSFKDFKQALRHDKVLSVSEVTPFLRVIGGDKAIGRKLEFARAAGKLIEGHTTGASVDKLNAIAWAGVTSCHESLSEGDVFKRLRLGYYVMLRHGSIRRDLPRLAGSIEKLKGYDTSRLMLVTDGIFPDHLISRGNMDWLVSEAVSQGIDEIRAVQMATLNPARYFRLDNLLGGIAPGRLAHLLLVESLRKPTPRLVMAKGRIVAEDGIPKINLFDPPEGELGGRPFRIGPFKAGTFQIKKNSSTSRVPLIRIVNQTVTALEEDELNYEHGVYDPGPDLLKSFLISRDGRKVGRGFVRGFCDGLGGIASSVSHETHGLLVMGQWGEDMALAANDVLYMGGGISVTHDGEVRARMSLPLGGICSVQDMYGLAQEIETLHGELKSLGCALEYPIWTLGFLTFTSVLRARLTYEGVYDVKEGKIVFS